MGGAAGGRLGLGGRAWPWTQRKGHKLASGGLVRWAWAPCVGMGAALTRATRPGGTLWLRKSISPPSCEGVAGPAGPGAAASAAAAVRCGKSRAAGQGRLERAAAACLDDPVRHRSPCHLPTACQSRCSKTHKRKTHTQDVPQPEGHNAATQPHSRASAPAPRGCPTGWAPGWRGRWHPGWCAACPACPCCRGHPSQSSCGLQGRQAQGRGVCRGSGGCHGVGPSRGLQMETLAVRLGP